MKKILFISILCLLMFQSQAQKNVNFSGEIKNLNLGELIYLGLDGFLLQLNLLEDGTFSADGNIQQTPSFFYFAKISKRGKIEKQTPLIWFEGENVEVTIDWSDKSFRVQELLPFQSISEKIEDLKGKSQIEFILKNPDSFPSLYFANMYKERISIRDLEILSEGINEENKNSVLFKRIENYVAAKKLETLKIGNKVVDFKLPNEEGKQVSIIDGSNKKRVIGLFTSGCWFSIASIDLLEQFADLSNDNIELVTIWEDPSKETWLYAHKDKKERISWTNLWDEYSFASTYLNRKMWPTFFVINEEGKLIKKFEGYSKKSAKKLKALLD